MPPGYPACPELLVLRGVLEVQATLLGPDLQVCQGLRWVHCVLGRPLHLAVTIEAMFVYKYN